MKKPLKITLISLGRIFVTFVLAVLFLLFDGSSRIHMMWHRVFSKPDDYIQKEILWPQRGRIFDRAGHVLCQDRQRMDIYMDCCVVEDSAKWVNESLALADSLSTLMSERTGAEWHEYFRNARRNHNRYIPIAKNISEGMRDTLAKLPLFRDGRLGGGFIVEYIQEREYPYGALARRTIGYNKGSGGGDFNSHIGLEGAYYPVLFGKKGERQVKYGVRRGELRHWDVSYISPENGCDLHTTLDMSLQAVADSAMRSILESVPAAQHASLVVMDMKSGAIRAMATLSRYADGESIGEYYNYAMGWHYALEVDPAAPGGHLSDFCLPVDMPFDIEGRRVVERSRDTVKVSALDILSLRNYIAAFGRSVQPYLVECITDGDQEVSRHETLVLRDDHLSSSDLSSLSESMASLSLANAAAATSAFPVDDPQYCAVCVLGIQSGKNVAKVKSHAIKAIQIFEKLCLTD